MENQKNNIFLGTAIGIAVFSLIGFLIMTAAYFEKSKELRQAYNSQNQEDNGGNNSAAANPSPISASDIKVTDQDWIRGNKNAPITIIEFSDFQCPYCAKFHQTLEEVVQNNNNVRWVYKYFPLPSHAFGRKSALAAACAGEQGKFWDYADQLFANQASFSESYFGELAGELKLDTKRFDACLSSEKYAKTVDTSYQLGQSAGVSATPTSFINGQKMEGAYPYDDVMNTIKNLSK